MNDIKFLGEYLSIATAISWTITAVLSEIGSNRFGALTLNVIRMLFAIIFLGGTLFLLTGTPYPLYTNSETWFWLSLSGIVGYVFGDICLFNAYVVIGSRFAQLFMTTAPATAALTSFLLLSETISLQCMAGIAITIFGIAISVVSKNSEESKHKFGLKLPLKGILLGIGAGLGQGVGLVLSKLGMSAYSLPADVAHSEFVLPFAATFMRSISGFIGFFIMAIMLHKTASLRKAATDAKGLSLAALLTIFGPFVGVSMSLMAVRYTAVGIAQTIMSLTPILILVPSRFVFHQKISLVECIGAVISVVGVSLFFI